MKTLIDNPKLEIESKEDGVWLFFNVGGLSSGINLSAYNRTGRMVDMTIQMWCESYALCEKERRKEPLLKDSAQGAKEKNL